MGVDDLDGLMNSETETVQIKGCPLCRKPIVNTYRYKHIINKKLKNDFNPIKEKVYGTIRQRHLKREELIKKVHEIGSTQLLAIANTNAVLAFKTIRAAIKVRDKKTSLLHLDMYHVYLDVLENLGEYYKRYKESNLTELNTEMQDQVKLICDVLVRNKQKISQQQQADIRNELKRLNSIIQLATIFGHGSYRDSKNVPNVAQAATVATDAVLSWRVFEEDKAVECLKKLQDAVKLSGIASKEERDMVVRAIGLKAGHWYKCPNGHFYCIGECGGAMQLANCPDCGAAIGGQNHALTAGNRHATEMDGSRFAAWSEEANNMANFNFDHLF